MRQYASGIAVAIRNYHSFRKSMQVGPRGDLVARNRRRPFLVYGS
jgi:hypothetical protein